MANSHHVARQLSYIVKSSLDLTCEQGTQDNRKAPFSHIHICKSFLESAYPSIREKDLRARMGGLWGREGVHPGRGPNGNKSAKAKSCSHSSGI